MSNLKSRPVAAASILAMAISYFHPSTAVAIPPVFTGLTNPFPGGYVASVQGVNATGTVVVGYTYKPTSPDFGDRSFRWRAGIGFDNPGPSQGVTLSYASGVSSTGNVVAGNTGHAQFGDQEAWVRVGNSTGHVGSPSGADFSVLQRVSTDGSVAVGWGGQQSNPNSGQAAFYNTVTDHWTNLGFLPGGSISKAIAASANGSVIVGMSSVGQFVSSAFVWRQSTGMQKVATGNLPAGTEAVAVGISDDGSVIVGTDYVTDPDFNSIYTAWKWTAASGMTPFATDFFLSGISPDGRVIVGTTQAKGYNQPAIWDETHGMRILQSVLAEQGVYPESQGWSMCCATAINQFGPRNQPTYVVAGEGGDPAGYIAGWVITIDPFAPVCPSIKNQPGDATVCPSGSALFGITATGDGPLSYRWQIETSPDVWATLGNDPMPMQCPGGGSGAFAYASNPFSSESPIGIHPCPGIHSYRVRCVVTNSCGSAYSEAAMLNICCPADANFDGMVNVGDLLAIINSWGACPSLPAVCPADIEPQGGDGFVNVADLLAVINHWGACQ